MADLFYGDQRVLKDDEPETEIRDEQPFEQVGHVRYYHDLVQGSDEWLRCRLGVMTASEMKAQFTAKLARANNETSRGQVYELMGDRITGAIGDNFMSYDMARGHQEEVLAIDKYSETYEKVSPCGFVTNDRHGFTLGFSPDGLVGLEGLVETKSRLPKFQARIIMDHILGESDDIIPLEFMIQLQTGLLVSERKWIDFLSYCGGMPMVRIRVLPDPRLQEMILDAAKEVEKTVEDKMARYIEVVNRHPDLTPTEPTEREEMYL